MSVPRSRYSRASEGEDIWLWVLGGVAALAFGLGGTVWAVGELAGLLFGSGRPGLAVADALEVLPRLSDHLSDPAQAWPAPGRERLPGPVGVYVSAVLVALAATAVVAGAASVWRRLAPGSSNRQGGEQSAWGRSRQLRTLAVARAETGRLTLGRIGRRLVAAETRQSVLVIAPTQAGKTTGLVIPAILEWQGPVLATSVKRDLLDETLARRRGARRRSLDPRPERRHRHRGALGLESAQRVRRLGRRAADG